MSKSDTKEARRCQPGKQNVGIMRFLLAGSVPFWAFVSDLDIAGRSAPEEDRAALLRRSAPPPRTALRGGTRRRPTPQSVLRAGSSRLIAYSVLRATSPQQQVAANNRDTRKAQDQ